MPGFTLNNILLIIILFFLFILHIDKIQLFIRWVKSHDFKYWIRYNYYGEIDYE